MPFKPWSARSGVFFIGIALHWRTSWIVQRQPFSSDAYTLHDSAVTCPSDLSRHRRTFDDRLGWVTADGFRFETTSCQVELSIACRCPETPFTERSHPSIFLPFCLFKTHDATRHYCLIFTLKQARIKEAVRSSISILQRTRETQF